MRTSTRLLLAVSLLTGSLGSAPGVGAQERGQALFDVCAACHGDDGAGDQQQLAPAIAGLPDWYVAAQLRKFRAGIRGSHFDDVGGMRMRPMARSLPRDEDVELVAAYVASLPSVRPEPVLVDGDAARGQALYITCAACHGVKGDGMQPLNGPRLTHTNDWYLAEQIRKFKSGVRAGSPEDTTGMLMRAMAMTLADDQAIHDVVAYIMTLSE